jgi:hypothetical protein
MATTLTPPSTSFEPTAPATSARHRLERRGSRLAASVRSESIKLTTVRAPRAILALTILVGGAASFMVAHFVDEPDISVATVFGFSAVFTTVFAAVGGILAYTTEAEHHTAHQTFAAEPRRVIVIAAKVITTAGYAALLGLAGLAAGAVGAALGGVEAGDTSTILPAMIGWATGFAVLSGILGLGVGLIARHSAAAISGLLVWWFVVENLISAFAPERVVRFMPFFAGRGMLDIADEGERIAFDRPATTLIFAAYAIAALTIGALATARTDP